MSAAIGKLSILFRFKLRNAHRILAAAGALLIHILLLSESGLGEVFTLLPDGARQYSPAIYVSLSPASVAATSECSTAGECVSAVRSAGSLNASGTPPHPEVHPKPQVSERNTGLAVKYYFRRSELTRPPQALTNPNIRLPENDDPRIIGAVWLRLFISEEGLVDDIRIVDSSLPDIYGAASVKGYKSVRFVPGEINGKAVRSQIQVEVDLTVDPMLSNVSRHGG